MIHITITSVRLRGFLVDLAIARTVTFLLITEKITRVPKHVKVAMTLNLAHLESLNFVRFVLGVLRVRSALQSTDRSNEPSPFTIWFELVKPVAKK